MGIVTAMELSLPPPKALRTLFVVLLLLLLLSCSLPFGGTAHDSADHGFSLSDVLSRYVVLLALAPVAFRYIALSISANLYATRSNDVVGHPSPTQNIALECAPILI